jgi:hypothetical protein
MQLDPFQMPRQLDGSISAGVVDNDDQVHDFLCPGFKAGFLDGLLRVVRGHYDHHFLSIDQRRLTANPTKAQWVIA